MLVLEDKPTQGLHFLRQPLLVLLLDSPPRGGFGHYWQLQLAQALGENGGDSDERLAGSGLEEEEEEAAEHAGNDPLDKR